MPELSNLYSPFQFHDFFSFRFKIRDKYQESPLDVASEFGDSDLVEFILAQKAQPLVTRFWGYTPLHLAAKKGTICLHFINYLFTL